MLYFCGMEEKQSIYSRLGEEKLHLLVDAFYKRVLMDDRINHLFQTDIELVKQKQFQFLSQFFGGPTRYSDQYGHPRMRLRHLPHKITADAAMAWLENMAEAIKSLNIEGAFKEEIFGRFPQVAAHMVNSQ